MDRTPNSVEVYASLYGQSELRDDVTRVLSYHCGSQYLRGALLHQQRAEALVPALQDGTVIVLQLGHEHITFQPLLLQLRLAESRPRHLRAGIGAARDHQLRYLAITPENC